VLDLPLQGVHFTLPMATPSQNEYQRWHWARRGKYRDACRLLIRAQVNRMSIPQRSAPVRAVVRFIRMGARLIDFGNLAGGTKAVLDSLVLERVIHDDSPRWVEEIYVQEPSRPPYKTTIWVYPAIEQHPRT
jgi:hypothetical protein